MADRSINYLTDLIKSRGFKVSKTEKLIYSDDDIFASTAEIGKYIAIFKPINTSCIMTIQLAYSECRIYDPENILRGSVFRSFLNMVTTTSLPTVKFRKEYEDLHIKTTFINNITNTKKREKLCSEMHKKLFGDFVQFLDVCEKLCITAQ